jgi:3-deoxy-manno-octulosonate cytidylyltransferase (CMP-KDO synthetase)
LENIIFIPARYSSSRLPGKVIMDLDGKSVIQRCYENALLSKLKSNVYILVDSDIVLQHCLGFTDNVILTNDKHESGTSRILEAIKKDIFKNTRNIINLQGDEPFISHSLIDNMFTSLIKGNKIVSCYHKISEKEALSPNNVKVVLNKNNNALYFSRSIIPFIRDKDIGVNYTYNQHIGLYGYKNTSLEILNNLELSELESKEKLEQLTFLYEDLDINMIEVNEKPIGIDTMEDYKLAVKRIMSLNKGNK